MNHPRIGQLCRQGKTVYYIVEKNGMVRESYSYIDLLNWLEKKV